MRLLLRRGCEHRFGSRGGVEDGRTGGVDVGGEGGRERFVEIIRVRRRGSAKRVMNVVASRSGYSIVIDDDGGRNRGMSGNGDGMFTEFDIYHFLLRLSTSIRRPSTLLDSVPSLSTSSSVNFERFAESIPVISFQIFSEYAYRVPAGLWERADSLSGSIRLGGVTYCLGLTGDGVANSRKGMSTRIGGRFRVFLSFNRADGGNRRGGTGREGMDVGGSGSCES